jgi:5-oxoprolinase (ATP-hydrolysing) subunit A
VQAAAVVAAVQAYDPTLPLLGLAGSAVQQCAVDAGVPFVVEAFADRAVTAAGRLVPRDRPGSVLHDPDEVVARAVRMVVEGRVTTADGTDADVEVASLCVHGDTPGAAALARAVRSALTSAGVDVRPFA